MGCSSSSQTTTVGTDAVPQKQVGDFREEMVWERRRAFDEVYEILRHLGAGAMGTVSLIKKRPSGNRSLQRSASGSELKEVAPTHLFVGKFVDFAGRGTKGRIAELRHEIDVLRTVDHPAIVHLREAYLHGRSIVHRDLKLPNVMAVAGDDLVVKIIDFGLSRVSRNTLDGSGHNLKVKAAGTMSTAAPEVARGGEYVAASDVFSVGCMCFTLVTKKNAFLEDHEEPTEAQLVRLNKGDCDWGALSSKHSKPCKEFLYRCFRPGADARWSADDALRFVIDVWRPAVVGRPPPLAPAPPSEASSAPPSPTRLAPELESSLKRYGSYNELKRAALLVAASQADHRKVDRCRRAFLDMDTKANGTVTLGAALGLDTKATGVFKSLDHDGSGQVHYHEFLAATIEAEGLLDPETLQDTFDRMDHDDTGVISPHNIRALLGTRASDDLVERMIADGDFKANGVVDFDEFAALMTNTPPPTHARATAPPAPPR
ncbi:serine/threonine kinase [Aureococcus anophagefferens]|nr:serine/threonine kinase [Aureococcus anophagefferens]